MKKKGFYSMMAVSLVAVVTLAGCSQNQNAQGGSGQGSSSNNLLSANWNQIAAQAKGQTVNMYMWGGGDTINRYIDDYVAPRLKQEAGITLHRVPVTDTKDIINKLLSDKQVGKKDGSADIMWINGENFLAAKQNHLLWGPFVDKLPNYNQYVDTKSKNITYDWGESTDGFEAPWGSAQFVYIYDSNKVPNPPKSMPALAKWVKAHPGKFTYPSPPDFTGAAFMRQVMYQTTGGYEQYMKPLDKTSVTQKLQPAWNYLDGIKHDLWRQGTTYPSSISQLDQLFGNGEVWLDMSYDPASASNEIAKGMFPKTTRTYVMDDGTLANTHYLAISFNSTHQAAAMTAINFLESPDAQITKFDPKVWGDGLALDVQKLSAADQKRVTSIDRGIATLLPAELDRHQVPEIPGSYVDFLQEEWTQNVAKK